MDVPDFSFDGTGASDTQPSKPLIEEIGSSTNPSRPKPLKSILKKPSSNSLIVDENDVHTIRVADWELEPAGSQWEGFGVSPKKKLIIETPKLVSLLKRFGISISHFFPSDTRRSCQLYPFSL